MRMGAPINADRIAAQLENRKRYHGKPCRNCGETEKYVENYACCACIRVQAKLRAKNKKAGVSKC